MEGQAESIAVWPGAAVRRRLTPRSRRTLLISVDVLLILLAGVGAMAVWAYRGHFRFGTRFLAANWIWIALFTLVWVVAAALNDLYRPHLARRMRHVLGGILRAQLVLLALYLVLYFVSRPLTLPRGIVLYYAVMATPLLLLWRWAFAAALAHPRFGLRAIAVGAGWAGQTLAQLLRNELRQEFEVIGFVDDDPAKKGATVAGYPVLGSSSDLPSLVARHNVQCLIVAITHGVRPELFRQVLRCQQQGIGVITMRALYERTLERTPIDHLSEQWFLELEPPDLLTTAVKRAVDVLFALVFGACFLALLPVIALAIWLEDRGPIFYRQKRLGQNGREFWVYKLRTMRVDAEKDGPKWTEREDSRVTRVGSFLRPTRLDELPQLWNLLKGEMSLVGPRPERPEFTAELERQIPYYRCRLSVKPGLTGWAQVRYRYGNSVEDARIKLEYDLYYIKHQSLLLDLSIILRTIGVVLAFRGQ